MNNAEIYICKTCNKNEEVSRNLKSDCREAIFICTGCGARGMLGEQFILQDALEEASS